MCDRATLARPQQNVTCARLSVSEDEQPGEQQKKRASEKLREERREEAM